MHAARTIHHGPVFVAAYSADWRLCRLAANAGRQCVFIASFFGIGEIRASGLGCSLLRETSGDDTRRRWTRLLWRESSFRGRPPNSVALTSRRRSGPFSRSSAAPIVEVKTRAVLPFTRIAVRPGDRHHGIIHLAGNRGIVRIQTRQHLSQAARDGKSAAWASGLHRFRWEPIFRRF